MNNSSASLATKTKTIFHKIFSSKPEIISIAPARVNIIGEHTDYNDGLSLPAAIDIWLYIGISKREDKHVRVYSENLKKFCEFDLNIPFNCKSLWEKYILGCIYQFDKVCKMDNGIDACIYSKIPIGAGVSSSAALEVALINGLNSIFNAGIDNKNIIKICQKVDHNHIRIKSGILDQSTVLLSKSNYLLSLDFLNNSFEHHPYNLKDCDCVLVDSGIRRELANSSYQERVIECKKGLQLLQKDFPKVKNFRDVTERHIKHLKSHDITSHNRIKHIFYENKRVELMLDSISRNDKINCGKYLLESHYSLRDLYNVSCEEIDFLIEKSSKIDGWYGGRIMGGGFGGQTINLIASQTLKAYKDQISSEYYEAFSIIPSIKKITFVKGAEVIS